MMKKALLSFAVAAAALSAVFAVPSNLEPVDGAVVSTHTKLQKSFLNMMPRTNRVVKFADKKYRERLAKGGWCPLPTELCWNAGGECEVEVRRKIDGKVVFSAKTSAGKVFVDNLEIACDYVWTVRDCNGEVSSAFRTEDEAPRLIRVPHIPNVRDLGGRTGIGGRRVKQNLIFRSAGFNGKATVKTIDNPETDKSGGVSRPLKGKNLQRVPGETYICDDDRNILLDALGIRSDIDLRSDEECFGMHGSPLGLMVKWFHYPSEAYGSILGETGRAAFKKVFEVFLDPKNYPVDFHCVAGQDRTGTVAFILSGLLGVDEDQLYLDWEATAFWNAKTYFNHGDLLDKLVDGLEKSYPEGQTIQEKIELYVKSLGFGEMDIAKFRDIMLEK